MSQHQLVEIYRAKNSLQAHMLKAVLEEAGIRAIVEGDALQSIMGEVPAGWPTAPRIVVAAGDASDARKIVEEYDRGAAAELPHDDS